MRRFFAVVLIVVFLLAMPFSISASAASKLGDDTDSFIFTDTDSGVTFTVPANWKQEEFYEEREYIDEKFVSTKEDGCIIYASTDMWGEMPASEKIGYSRSDLNNSIFTKSDIATICNTTADKISTVTYNGTEYFKGETNYTTNAYGVDITITMTQLTYFNNGWMYMFQFAGTSTHSLYSDFESLLKSVRYPTASNIAGGGSTNNLNSVSNNLLFNLVISLVITLVAYAVFPLIFARMRQKIITKKTYNLLCFGFNFLVMLAFVVARGEASSAGPYALWTWVFSSSGIKTLRSRGVLEGSQPVSYSSELDDEEEKHNL